MGIFSNHLRQRNQIPSRVLICLLVLMLFSILLFGLMPDNLSFANIVHRELGSSGIKFGKQGIAYTEPFLETSPSDISADHGFSFEISIKPDYQKEGGFRFILVLHNGKDNEQLLMGQWQTHIIVMNGDDYSYKRRIKRITVDTAAIFKEKMFIAVTTGAKGTKIYINGKLLREKADLTLKMPNKEKKARLTLGNSVYGQNSWQGIIYGLAFYQYELTDKKVSRHYDQWLKNSNFTFAQKENPYLLYLFDKNNNLKSLDHSGQNNHINIPARMKILKPKLLRLPSGAELAGWSPQDIVLNLLGFIPFGFILSSVLARIQKLPGKQYLSLTVFFGFLLSLTIEFCQSWIPVRDSNLLDLFLNTFGTLIGASIYMLVFIRHEQSRKPVVTGY